MIVIVMPSSTAVTTVFKFLYMNLNVLQLFSVWLWYTLGLSGQMEKSNEKLKIFAVLSVGWRHGVEPSKAWAAPSDPLVFLPYRPVHLHFSITLFNQSHYPEVGKWLPARWLNGHIHTLFTKTVTPGLLTGEWRRKRRRRKRSTSQQYVNFNNEVKLRLSYFFHLT